MASNDSKRYYWLKLKKDFFQQHQIKVLKALPNGRLYALIYLELLAESTSHNGELRYSQMLPYDVNTLASVIDEDVDNLKCAIDVLTQLELVEILEDQTIYMREIQSMIGSETGWANKKRKQTQLPKLMGNCKRLNGSSLMLPNGNVHYIDEKRYGGNGMLVMSMANGICECCGSDENVRIHHNNGYSNNINDLVVLCGTCHGIAHNSENKGHIDIDLSSRGKISTELPLEYRDKSIDIRDKNIYIKKHKYGSYNNVLLTDQELETLKNEFSDYEQRIERVSEYCASTGKSYKNYLATIRNWARKEKPKESFDTMEYDSSNNPTIDKSKLEEILKNRGAK